ncbi:MAG: hypothetical protein J6A59_11880 [Lachnospiraceae bacterium]|nr:hypothetical protein [Lachnospiraceae bacterium]
MEQTKSKLTAIADVLYKGDTLRGMAMMSEVIPNLATVGGMINDEELRDRYVNEGLAQALAAMESGDGTLLADIISYEIIEVIDVI